MKENYSLGEKIAEYINIYMKSGDIAMGTFGHSKQNQLMMLEI